MIGLVIFDIIIAIADCVMAGYNFANGNVLWGIVGIFLCIALLVAAGMVWAGSR